MISARSPGRERKPSPKSAGRRREAHLQVRNHQLAVRALQDSMFFAGSGAASPTLSAASSCATRSIDSFHSAMRAYECRKNAKASSTRWKAKEACIMGAEREAPVK